MPRRPKCPKCKSPKTMRIIYGMPVPETFELMKVKNWSRGGCCISDQSEKWECPDCGHKWGLLYEIPDYSKIPDLKDRV